MIAEITGPKATADEAEFIRGRLRRTVLRYESPNEPALAPEEWAVSRD